MNKIMKVKVKETQEIIDVEFAHTVNSGGQIEKIWQDSFSGKLYPASLLEQIIEEKESNIAYGKIIKTSKHILNKWIDEHLSVHSDWTGSRIETIDTCDSLDEFLDKLWNYLEEESDRLD